MSAARTARPASQACRAGPAQQLQQQSLRLIVPVLGQQQEIRLVTAQRPPARGACRSFGAKMTVQRYVNPLHCQWHAQIGTERAAESLPIRGIRAQSMMNMNRPQGKSQRTG